jgi:type IV pilus assembly protein PilB
MATPTPNNPNPPKKPVVPPAKPGPTPVAKGVAPGKTNNGDGAAPPVKPGDGKPVAGKPGDGKPVAGKPVPAKPAPAKPAPRPAAKPAKPAPAEPKAKAWVGADGGNRKFGQVLVDLGYIDQEQLWDLLEQARGADQSLSRVVLDRGLVTEDQLLQAQGERHGLKVANLEESKPTPEALKLVPENMAQIYKILPLKYEADTLTVVMSDPDNLSALDDLRNFLGIKQVEAVLALPRQIEEAQKVAYAGKQESILDLIASLEADAPSGGRGRETSIDLEDMMELAESAPVRKLINMMLLMGIKDRASDIHFEPFEEEYKIRMRCDGTLYEMVPPPRHLAAAISSRIKVMSNLDIAERRLPQDGRIELNVGGNPVDLRVSVLPTMFGESIVIRVLDRTVVSLDLEKVGMEAAMLASFREMIHKPNGIVLVTGPTGAGKTTTLYSALNELNQITDKIITTEDPVEYEIDGIVQCPINHEIDLTFASALRAILRQDPDIILVGEIRDLETAQIAVQASLTGHMVFSTLHTNDAPSTITRLRDMGIEPFLITATVEGILAQRLVRKICTGCKTEYDPPVDQILELGLKPDQAKAQGIKFFYGAGCDKCNNLGFKGRSGIYELITMTDHIRDLVSNGASTDQLRASMRQMGGRGLREAGLAALTAGVTTIDEIVRETVLEDEG